MTARQSTLATKWAFYWTNRGRAVRGNRMCAQRFRTAPADLLAGPIRLQPCHHADAGLTKHLLRYWRSGYLLLNFFPRYAMTHQTLHATTTPAYIKSAKAAASGMNIQSTIQSQVSCFSLFSKTFFVCSACLNMCSGLRNDCASLYEGRRR